MGPPLSPSRACLTVFIADSVPFVFVSLGQFHAALLPHLPEKGRGGWSGTQKFVYQKRPDRIFPMANAVFSHGGHFGLGGEGVQSPPHVLLRCAAILILPCTRALGVFPLSSGA